MIKNGTEFYRDAEQTHINLIKLKYLNSKSNNTMNKYNFSKNLFSNSKKKTSFNLSNYNIYKNSQISNNNIKDISYKNKINSISTKKIIFEDSSHSGSNFRKKLSANNNRNKVFELNARNMKNNTNFIHSLNITQNKKRKLDSIKYKFLSGPKKNYKKIILHNDSNFSSYHSKKINSVFCKNINKHHLDSNKLKIFSFEKDETNAYSIKDGNELFSNSSLKNLKKINYNKNNFGIDNYSTIKIKNYNTPTYNNKSNEILFNYKNIAPIKNFSINEKLKTFIKNKNQPVNKENKELNNLRAKIKIIDNIYNEYLKGISSSESNKRIKRIMNKNINNIINKSLKSLKDRLSFDDKNELFRHIKRLKKYNYSSIIIKNNKSLLESK